MSIGSEQTHNKEDEITVKQIILTVKDYFFEVTKNWKIGLYFIIPFVIWFVYRGLSTEMKYSGTLTFMINEDEGGSSAGGAAALLSQFGFGGGGGGGQYNLQKMIELAKSRKIIQSVLLRKVNVVGKEDFIGNHIIDLYKLHDDWEENSFLRDFKFTHDSVEIFNRSEIAAIKRLRLIILGFDKDYPRLLSTDLDDETGIMTLTSSTLSEGLTIGLLQYNYEVLTDFYITGSIEKQKKTYDLLKEKVDSIGTALNSAELELAKFEDSNRGLYAKISFVKSERMKRNIQILSIMYGEAIRNLEVSDFNLKSATPSIQVIDEPVAPLKPEGVVLYILIIQAVILGGFLATGFIVTRKFIRDAMAGD